MKCQRLIKTRGKLTNFIFGFVYTTIQLLFNFQLQIAYIAEMERLVYTSSLFSQMLTVFICALSLSTLIRAFNPIRAVEIWYLR